MPGPRSTSHIKQYTPTQFSAAIAAVSSGSLSIRKAAQAHSIPFSTLQRHFQGTPQAKRSYEASSREMQKLTPEQEENIAMWVLAQENLGLPVKMEDIRRFADRVLEVGLKEGQGMAQVQKRGGVTGSRGRKAVAGKDGKDGQEAEGQQQGEEEERSTTTSTVTVGKHWGPKFMQRHPQLKAAREARRKELKKGLRRKQAATATTTAATAAAVINTPTPAAAATNSHQLIGLPQTPTPAVSGGGQRQRNGPQQKNNGQLQIQQQQQQDDEDVDPELMDQDQDQTVIMEEAGHDDEDMEDDDDIEAEQNDTVHVKDELEEEEYYEDEQTPDQQLLMDSQRYSRFATTNGSY